MANDVVFNLIYLKKIKKREIPPIPFLVATFTQPCHNLLLQVRDREALEALIRTRGIRGEELRALPRELLRRTIRRNRLIVRHFQARDVVLKHIRYLFEPPQTEQRPRSQLQRFVEPRIDRQSRVEKVERRSDLALFLRGHQSASVSDVFLNNLQ